MFEGADGDRLNLLVERTSTGWRLSDDGHFLGSLAGFGIDVLKGGRRDFLARALRPASAVVDSETLQVVSDIQDEPTPRMITNFLVALSRAQDVTFWTKERVRTTFREDATRAIQEILQDAAELLEHEPVDQSMREFPADLLIRPRIKGDGSSLAAIYLVQGLEGLQEAMALAQELRVRQRTDVRVAALIEDGSINTGGPRAIRAINRIDAISFFRDDESAAAFRMVREAIPHLMPPNKTVAH
jgi:hypothetical protein